MCARNGREENGVKLLPVYLLAVNLLGFALMAADKKRARENRWRISERTLLLTAAAGGSVGVLLAMAELRHKTKHPKFTIGVPVILLLQTALAVAAAVWGSGR